jgi:hypothetical protein
VRFTGPPETATRLAEIAEQYGATIEGPAAMPAFDLLDAADPDTACRVYLAGNGASG